MIPALAKCHSKTDCKSRRRVCTERRD